jgi:hypothetical protein
LRRRDAGVFRWAERKAKQHEIAEIEGTASKSGAVSFVGR